MTSLSWRRLSDSLATAQMSQLSNTGLATALRRPAARRCVRWSAPIALHEVSAFAAPFVGDLLVPGRRLAIAQQRGFTFAILGDALLGRFPSDVEIRATAAVRIAHIARRRDGRVELTVRVRMPS